MAIDSAGELLAVCRENKQTPIQLLAILNASEQGIQSLWREAPALMSELHLGQHSLPCTFLLEAMGAQGEGLSEEHRAFFLDQARRLMLCADSVQVQLVPARFAAVCRTFKDLLVHGAKGRPAKEAIRPLQHAIRVLQPAGSDAVTPIHADLLQVCLLSKHYAAGFDLLYPSRQDQDHSQSQSRKHNPFVIIDPKKTGLTVTAFLLFCYYGGMVCVGRRRLREALRFFLSGLTVPASQLSAIMVECYKKFVLVSLIHEGALPQIPEYVSQVVQRTVGSHCGCYLELAKTFASHDLPKLEAFLQKEEVTRPLQADGNAGLARQCLKSLKKRVVQRLTRTYLTLSLQDVGRAAGLGAAEAEQLVREMIGRGEIRAKISMKERMVLFDESAATATSGSTGDHGAGGFGDPAHWQHRIDACIHIAAQVQRVDDNLSHNRRFLQNTAIQDASTRFDVS